MARDRLSNGQRSSSAGREGVAKPPAARPGPIEWIFFDAGGTLFDTLLTADRLLAALGKRASGLDRAALAARLPEAYATLGHDHLGPPPDVRVDPRRARQRWLRLLDALVVALGVEPPRAAVYRSALWRAFAAPSLFPLYPEVLSVLQELRRSGFRMAIVSNWERRLERLCAAHGLRAQLEFVLASERVGFAKPGAPIFQEALRLAGSEPGRVLYVGDSLELDARAADAVGLAAVLVDRGPYYPPDAWPRTIKSLAELPSVLAAMQPAGR